MDEYLATYLWKERSRELRRMAARQALLREARLPRAPLRVVLGLTLIRAGRFLVRGTPTQASHSRA